MLTFNEYLEEMMGRFGSSGIRGSHGTQSKPPSEDHEHIRNTLVSHGDKPAGTTKVAVRNKDGMSHNTVLGRKVADEHMDSVHKSLKQKFGDRFVGARNSSSGFEVKLKHQ